MKHTALIFLALLAPTPLHAQSVNVLKRAEELAKIQELINDPNPQMRIAHFEDIAASGDAVKLQTAVQIALTGNDQLLRSVAFRTYLAATPHILLEFSLEPEIQKAVEKSKAGDRQAHQAFLARYSYISNLLATGMRGDIAIKDFNVTSGRGKAHISFDYGGQNPVDVSVSGDRFVSQTRHLGGTSIPCNIELRPNRDLQLVGSMTCQNTGFGKITLTAPMF